MNPIAVMGDVGWLLTLCGSVGSFLFGRRAIADWPETERSHRARYYADLCFTVAMLGVTAIICAAISA